jgi:agmatinase
VCSSDLAIKTKKVYLTIDLDGIDPAHVPSVGTPLPGGLEWNYTLKLIREIFKRFDVVGADVLEFSPEKKDLLTAHSAAQLCYNLISYKLLKDKGKLKFF